MKKSGNSRNEIRSDYKMLEKMSDDLKAHRENLKAIGKHIAKGMKTDMRFGIIENLDMVAMHMNNAKRELEKAKKTLKLI